jgi:hypothetical protein
MKITTNAAAAIMGMAKSRRKAESSIKNGKLGGRPIMKRHQIIIATIKDGNVQKISRHMVTGAVGAARMVKVNCQLWMTIETAQALNGDTETFWGRLPDGTEYQIKTEHVMETA